MQLRYLNTVDGKLDKLLERTADHRLVSSTSTSPSAFRTEKALLATPIVAEIDVIGLRIEAAKLSTTLALQGGLERFLLSLL